MCKLVKDRNQSCSENAVLEKKTKRRRNIYIYNYVIDEYEKEQKTRPDVDNLIFKDYIISQNNDVYCK